MFNILSWPIRTNAWFWKQNNHGNYKRYQHNAKHMSYLRIKLLTDWHIGVTWLTQYVKHLVVRNINRTLRVDWSCMLMPKNGILLAINLGVCDWGVGGILNGLVWRQKLWQDDISLKTSWWHPPPPPISFVIVVLRWPSGMYLSSRIGEMLLQLISQCIPSLFHLCNTWNRQ